MHPPQSAIRLIVGLGNPGAEYARTRHNAGFWFVDALADRHGVKLKIEGRFHGAAAKLATAGAECWLLEPGTFMNRSGESIAAFAHFYRIAPEEILVAHDELDLPAGTVRLKQGGGHGGHNGLRDTHQKLGSNAYARLRLGIGHPGASHLVTGYVLGRAPAAEEAAVLAAVGDAVDIVPLLLKGEMQRAMNILHQRAGNAPG